MQATVQEWQPMHLRLSMTNPYLIEIVLSGEGTAWKRTVEGRTGGSCSVRGKQQYGGKVNDNNRAVQNVRS
ncbi:hypothetical protein SBA1_1040009 [Candidatus Sulfotelmatobacter kueseliae]|uniref:Uncharacterized protein n=1 Tax=Candidatus Sulfotelmatobacter kueseliae TaxID=2042962 RepID=A0A2U3JXT4_9BACT|nr:hypothetical protein SBA1_1040009 [Candidatus Sulfotelmatobacter kueseliae]